MFARQLTDAFFNCEEDKVAPISQTWQKFESETYLLMFPNEKEITTKLFVEGLLDITCLDS